jgi:hypothetical protein
MSFVIAAPETMTAAASDLAGIQSALSASKEAADEKDRLGLALTSA